MPGRTPMTMVLPVLLLTRGASPGAPMVMLINYHLHQWLPSLEEVPVQRLRQLF